MRIIVYSETNEQLQDFAKRFDGVSCAIIGTRFRDAWDGPEHFFPGVQLHMQLFIASGFDLVVVLSAEPENSSLACAVATLACAGNVTAIWSTKPDDDERAIAKAIEIAKTIVAERAKPQPQPSGAAN